jgi:hypothetical protein
MSDHVIKAGEIHRAWALRAFSNAANTAQLFAQGMDQKTRDELVHMGEAAWTRLRTLRENWIKDWAGWLDYASELKGANTMSKLAEREGNIFGQAAQILCSQATDLVGLQENIAVDYGYWVSEKLGKSNWVSRS